MYKHAMHMVYIAALANCNVIISHMQYICNPTLLFTGATFLNFFTRCCYIRQHSFTCGKRGQRNVNSSPTSISSSQCHTSR